MTIEEFYTIRCNTPHNIDTHLPMLKRYAGMCRHVTEFGVDKGWSTTALLTSGATFVRSYDIVRQPEVTFLEQLALEAGVDWKFILADTRKVEIEQTDLLFIDTDHTYDQLKAELAQSIDKVNRFLVFHDTVSFPDMVPAIAEMTQGWNLIESVVTQHGFTVLERGSY